MKNNIKQEDLDRLINKADELIEGLRTWRSIAIAIDQAEGLRRELARLRAIFAESIRETQHL